MNKALKRNKKPWKETRYYQQYLVKRAIKISMAAQVIASNLAKVHGINHSNIFGPAKAALLALNQIKTIETINRIMK